MNPTTSIINREFAQGPYNILTVLSPDLCYDHLLCGTGHNFYTSGKWGREFWGHLIDKPENLEFFLNDPPVYLDFHFVLCHNRIEQYSLAEQISRAFHIPVVCINHSAVNGLDRNPQFAIIKNRHGHFSIYNNQGIMESWGGVGAIIPPGVPTVFNNGGRTDKIEVLMLEPRDQKQEEIAKIIGKEFSSEFLSGRNLEDLAKQYKNAKVYLDLNGPEFCVSSVWAVASGCQIVAIKRIESAPYLVSDDKFTKLSELIENIKGKLENPTNNNIEMNTVEEFNSSMNFIFGKAASIVYER